MRNVTLYLENGSRFSGQSFGYEKPVTGEVVFTTAMSGYPETLTDPASEGQLVAFTYPLIGNYGVQPRDCDENGLLKFFEGEKIYASAVIVSDYSDEYNHWNAKESLAEWLKREQTVGITGIDTRELTKILRDNGTMTGKIVFEEGKQESLNILDFLQPEINHVARVSCNEVITYNEGEGKKKVILVDCGVRYGIIRCLLKYDVTVVRVPWNYDFSSIDCEGICIAGGPGNPYHCDETVKNIQKVMTKKNTPILAIGLGSLLLGKAAGASVYKLKFGHHGHSQPIRLVGTNRCFVTTQSHNYALDADTLSNEWKPLFININDGSNEGFAHNTKPWTGIQFHTESESIATDTQYIFDDFVKSL